MLRRGLGLMWYGVPRNRFSEVSNDLLMNQILDLCIFVHQAGDHGGQVYAAGVVELQAEVDGWLEYYSNPVGFSGWFVVAGAGDARLESSRRLEWRHGQPGQVSVGEHHRLFRYDFRCPALYSVPECRRQGLAGGRLESTVAGPF